MGRCLLLGIGRFDVGSVHPARVGLGGRGEIECPTARCSKTCCSAASFRVVRRLAQIWTVGCPQARFASEVTQLCLRCALCGVACNDAVWSAVYGSRCCVARQDAALRL